MMSKLRKITAGVFLTILVGLPSFAFAQAGVPGGSSSGQPTSVYDYAKEQKQKREEQAKQEEKKQDTGENYGVGNLLGDAYSDAADRVDNAYKNTSENVSEALGGGTGAKILGAVAGKAAEGFARVTSIFDFVGNVFGNINNLGGDIMEYVDPYTGEKRKYVKTIWGGAEATTGVLKGCPPVAIKIVQDADCIFCPLFTVLYAAANEMSTMAFSKLGGPMATVMLIGFAIFVGFKVLTHVSALTKQDAPKFLGELLTQSFKVLIAFLLLMTSNQIYQYFISPVLGAGLEFGSAMLFENPEAFAGCTANISIANDTSLLPVSLYAKLDCFIRAIQSEIAVSQAIGSSLMCVGRNEAAGELSGIWDFGMVFQGLIIWGFAVMLSLAFAFYLIDATVNLGLVGALMPFLIASWPFKLTNGYTKTGIGIFLNTFFVFVFMGIVVSINMQLIGQALTQGGSAAASSSATSGESSGGGLTEMAKALSSDDMKKLKDLTDIGFGGFLILLCCCIFGFKFTNQAESLATQMSGSSGGISGIGKNIGGMAAGGAAKLASKATQPARKAISNKANELTGRAGEAIGKRIGLGKHGGKTGSNKGGAAASGASGGGGSNSSGGGNNSGGNANAPTPANNRRNPTEGRNLAGGLQGRNDGDGGGGNS